MAKKRYRPEEIIGKLREADVLLSQGKKVVDVIKALGVTDVPQAKRLKELEKENERLRKAVSDLTLDKMILKKAAKGNF
jgi:putative transposase